MRTQNTGNHLRSGENVFEFLDYCKGNEISQDDRCNKDLIALPTKRPTDFSEVLLKKSKTLPVTYGDWEPFSKALLSLEFNEAEEILTEKDIKERKEIANRMSTPEGLSDIITELEGRLSQYEDIPIDPDFENLSLEEKIEKLFQDFLVIK